MAKIFLYLFTAMLHDVTITSLLCLCIICYKIDVPAGRFIHEREHFCRNVMVSVRVSHMGKTNMIFFDPDGKVNSSYHFWFVLGKGLLPDIQARCCQQKWAFQQDGAPMHTARRPNATDYLKKERLISSSLTCGPQTAPIIILLAMLLGAFSKESTMDENLTQWKNWSER